MSNWIPVKERLPDQSMDVLLSIRKKNNRRDYISTGIWTRLLDLDTGEFIGPYTFVYIAETNGRAQMFDYLKDDSIQIVAWMPYPKPYTADFKVIVAGSRSFDDYDLLKETLDKAFSKHMPTHILCGEAKGADTLGKQYAKEHNILVESYPADWKTYGKQAGFIRNEQMADNADALIAFHVNDSAGTKHMINTAKKQGLQVRVIKV